MLAGVGLAAVLVWTGVVERQQTTQPVTSTPGRPPASSLPALEWHDVASWASSGGGDSPPFHISADPWRVTWAAPHDSVGDGSLAVYVYSPEGLLLLDLYDTADSPGLNFDGPLTGTLGVPGSGDFVLRMVTARDYKVTVQELR